MVEETSYSDIFAIDNYENDPEKTSDYLEMINFYYKVRSFKFTSNGVSGIPVKIEVSDSFNTPNVRQFGFTSDEADRHNLEVNFEISTFYVIRNERAKLTDKNRVSEITAKLSAEK